MLIVFLFKNFAAKIVQNNDFSKRKMKYVLSHKKSYLDKDAGVLLPFILNLSKNHSPRLVKRSSTSLGANR